MTWPRLTMADLPVPPSTEILVLRPLAPEHNERDHAAWMSSIEHIRSTPGFGDGTWGPDTWPFEMTSDQNLGDLVMHWNEFVAGDAFAYTVLDPTTDDVIGCVYIDPDTTDEADAQVRSWVRSSSAALDTTLFAAVDDWLRSAWPFDGVRWPGRIVTR